MSVADILAAFPPGERTLPACCNGRRAVTAAIVCSWRAKSSWSFEDAPAIAARFAGTLAAAGIRPGDRVALMCSNRAEFMECFLGCAWLGAIAVPINVASRGPQLRHIPEQFRRPAVGHRGGIARCARRMSI